MEMQNRSRASLLSPVLLSVLTRVCLCSAHGRWPASPMALDCPANWNEPSQVSQFVS